MQHKVQVVNMINRGWRTIKLTELHPRTLLATYTFMLPYFSTSNSHISVGEVNMGSRPQDFPLSS